MAKAIKGQLKKENFGYSMPGDAPLYNKPPIYYKNVEVTFIPFETDAAAAAAMLPEGLELAPTATAAVLFVNYNFSSLGAYHETILSIDCLFEGAPKSFFPHIVVGGNEVPLAAGREIWGYSKKLADIQITREGDLTLGTMERPRGNRIVTGIFKPEVRVPDAEIPLAPVSLRVIPGADSDEPALAELIEAPCSMTNLDLWMGTGSLQFNSTSAFDPWHKLEIKNVLPSMYLNYDAELGLPIVLKRY